MSVSSSASPALQAGRGLFRIGHRQDRRRLLRWMGVSFIAPGVLSACGKKGELELPPPESIGGDESSAGDRQ